MDCQPRGLRRSCIMPLTTVHVMVAHASVASNKPQVELDLYLEKCVVGDNCLVLHDHNTSVNVYSCNIKDGHRGTSMLQLVVEVYFDDMLSCPDQWSRELFVTLHAVSSEWCAYQ